MEEGHVELSRTCLKVPAIFSILMLPATALCMKLKDSMRKQLRKHAYLQGSKVLNIPMLGASTVLTEKF